jgi:putative membrane protein
MRSLILRWVILAVAFAVTSKLLHGMRVTGGVAGYLWVSALFGIVNAVLGTLLRIVTFPLTILTFGLFLIVVNAILLEITDSLSSHLFIDRFWWTAIWAAIILSLTSLLLDRAVDELLEESDTRRRRSWR